MLLNRWPTSVFWTLGNGAYLDYSTPAKDI